MKRPPQPIFLFLLSILILLGVLRTYSPPDPLPIDAPAEDFSAGRADAVLRGLLDGVGPHVSGSAANDIVRDRVIAYLEAAGYETEIQSRYHCNPEFGSCCPVQNVIAVRRGTVGEDAILLTAHYDSQWAAPGAADDGAGTAVVLEIARMLAALPESLNDVIFLLSDGEEQGLVGAHAFAELHPLFAGVRVVINLEARGGTGASAMFETGDGNSHLIRTMAKSLDRPVANSLAYEVYKRMPNDTDYTVYKRQGVMGLNFAFSRGVALYHSLIDDPDHLDLGSLQHHGDNAWAMVKELANTEMERMNSPEDAGYVDLFAMKLLHYPVGIERGLALVLIVVLLLGITFFHSRDLHLEPVLWSVAAVAFVLLIVPAGAWLLSWPLGGWLDLHPLEHPQPWIGRLVLFLELVLGLRLTIGLFVHRISRSGLLLVGWSCFSVLAVVLAYRLPTAAYVAMIPLLTFALGMIIDLVRVQRGDGMRFAAVFGFAGAVYMGLYHFFLLDTVLNFDRSHLKILPLLLIVPAALPLLADEWGGEDRETINWLPAGVLLVMILSGTLIHVFMPGFTPDRPRPMNFVYEEVEGEKDGRLMLESLFDLVDEGFATAIGFEQTEINTRDKGGQSVFAIRVPRLNLPQVSTRVGPVEIAQDGTRHYRISLLPPAGVERLTVVPDREANLRTARVNGVLVLDTAIESKHSWRWGAIRLTHPGERSLELELVTDGDILAGLTVISRYPLPEALVAPYRADWPDDSQPVHLGPRAVKYESIALPGTH